MNNGYMKKCVQGLSWSSSTDRAQQAARGYGCTEGAARCNQLVVGKIFVIMMRGAMLLVFHALVACHLAGAPAHHMCTAASLRLQAHARHEARRTLDRHIITANARKQDAMQRKFITQQPRNTRSAPLTSGP
jgi:hypothetical protein